ncbi:MAG: hypothetical protein K2K73_02525 [Ureaplasma sp.]|nr:hypothetical protein [Ureaplasma sp.]
MKKSKIIGLSLGFSALAAVAISTPFVITACSESSTTNNEITAKISNTFATGTVGNAANPTGALAADNIVSVGSNSIDIYTGETTVADNTSRAAVQNTFVKLTLKTSLADIISAEDIKNAGLSNSATIKWEFENSKWDFNNNVLSNKEALENDETITLKATITDVKQPEAATYAEGEENTTSGTGEGEKPSEGTTTPETKPTEPEKITKTLSVKITFKLGNKA